jgi:hypothetical protein
MTDPRSQNVDIRTTESGFRYHRGSALTIFKSDRHEDFMALIFAALIAFGVYFFIN